MSSSLESLIEQAMIGRLTPPWAGQKRFREPLMEHHLEDQPGAPIDFHLRTKGGSKNYQDFSIARQMYFLI